MSGSSIGKLFTLTTFGESHGKAIGAVVDGCPAGLPLCEEDIQKDLDRRKPGQSKYSSKRSEADQCEILSGVFEGKTTGTPISILIPNENQIEKDYSDIAEFYRPSHADYTYDMKYGHRDYRGGGRSSGRETAARVAGGAIARKILETAGIYVQAYTVCIGDISVPAERFNPHKCPYNPLVMPDDETAKKAEEYLEDLIKKGDSTGSVVQCHVHGTPLPAGLGEPVFSKLDAEISKAIMSIGAVKAIEFGAGFKSAYSKGSINNDPFTTVGGMVYKQSNNAGGVLGGMSDGSDLVFNVAIKPPPSIGIEQESIDKFGNIVSKTISGRHDPVIAPRAVVVIEAMTCLVLCDMLFQNMSAKIENIKKIYL